VLPPLPGHLYWLLYRHAMSRVIRSSDIATQSNLGSALTPGQEGIW
jgi:hypothetical protein